MDSKNVSAFKEALSGKNIIVDTSSLLLSGVNLLTAIPECTIIIPSIVVKELEDKRTNPNVGFAAREWLRLLEALRVKYKTNLSEGVPLRDYENVSLKVEANHSTQKSLPQHLQDGSNDSTILAVAKNIADEIGFEDVVLLSNDTPMRIHATLDLRLESVEFSTTLAEGIKPFDGKFPIIISTEKYIDSELVTRASGQKFENFIDELLPEDIPSHALVSLKLEGEYKNLIDLVYENGFVEQVQRKQKASNIVSRNLEQDVALTYLKESAYDLPVVSIGGNAGTGKTLLCVAVGLDELKAGNYQRLIVFRSLHEMGQGQEMGFLPGDVGEKMEAWAGAVYDALDIIATYNTKPSSKTAANIAAEAKKLRELVEVSPITYLRGRSLSNSFIILEEAQNFSRNEILNILSRAGENTKMVFTFDSNQVDNKFLQSGSKADIWSVVDDLKNEDLFAHITLENTERSRVAEVASSILSSK